jgi:hypothetical protein
LVGNAYDTETSTGRYDALTGLLLLGNGKGKFLAQKSVNTGFKATKNSKSLVEISYKKTQKMMLVGNNSDNLQAFFIHK